MIPIGREFRTGAGVGSGAQNTDERRGRRFALPAIIGLRILSLSLLRTASFVSAAQQIAHIE
jgi:hypothetical protein